MSAYASALEKLRLLASFAKRHPDTTAEKLIAEVATGEVYQALRWFGCEEAPIPPWSRVVELLGAGFVESYFDTAAGRVMLSLSQKGREKLAEGQSGFAWDGKLLTAQEAAEVLSMLEHYRQRGESNSWEEDD